MGAVTLKNICVNSSVSTHDLVACMTTVLRISVEGVCTGTMATAELSFLMLHYSFFNITRHIPEFNLETSYTKTSF